MNNAATTETNNTNEGKTMTAKAFYGKAIKANERTLLWQNKVDGDNYRDWKKTERLEDGLNKADDALRALIQSVSEMVFDESGVGGELCCNWEDWQ
jgi:hypothetical protein